MTLQELIQAQRQFSAATFGPTMDPRRNIAHLELELNEIDADPSDIKEWADALLISLDGWWRSSTEATINYFDPVALSQDREIQHTFHRGRGNLYEHLERLSEAPRLPEMYEILTAEIFIIAEAHGHHAEQLINEARLKIEINKRRDWHIPIDPTQPVRHRNRNY